jgi:2-dehydro-3-deoxygluconokinase
LTGITAALSDSCYEMVAQVMQRARDAGVMVSFDVNYRAKLWDVSTAGTKPRPLIADADIVFCKSSDAPLLFGCDSEPRELMLQFKSLTHARSVFCAFGEKGAALLMDDEFMMQPALPVQIVDRIGSGDAVAAGAFEKITSAAQAIVAAAH